MAKKPDKSAAAASPDAAQGVSRVALIALVAANLMIGGLVVWLVFFYGRGQIDTDATLAAALSALDENDRPRARALAEALLTAPNLDAGARGGPLFVLGAIASQEAEDAFEPERAEQFALAARQLEDARRIGLPQKCEGQGLLLLGRALLALNRAAESRLALEAALAKSPENRPAVLALLADAQANDSPPDVFAALANNEALLAEGSLSPTGRQQALLQRARLMLRAGQPGEVGAIVAQIPPKTALEPDAKAVLADARLAEAQLLRAAGDEGETPPEAIAAYREAMALYRAALSGATLSRATARWAHLSIGECLLALGDKPAALAQFVRTRRLHPQTPEGIVANLREAQIALDEKDYHDTVAALARAVQAAGDPAQFHNPVLTLEQFRGQCLTTFDEFNGLGEYDLAVELAERMEPIVPHDRAIELAALARRNWGEGLLVEGDALPRDEGQSLRNEGRQRLREAGLAYEELAQFRTTERSYVDHLWASAECLLAGRDYAGAQRLLEKYLQEESRRRRPLALVSLGEALLAENRPHDALAVFADVLEAYPRDAMAYRARLLSSATYFELGELESCEAQLMALLNDDQLTPNSQEWRDALFRLGRLLHFEGRYEEALARLDEAVARYPDLPVTLEARFLAAESYRLRAWELRDSINEQTPENQRLEDLQRSEELLEASLARYATLQDRLLEVLEGQQLDAAQRSVLRNSYFSRGAVLMSLSRWEEAVRTFMTLTNRYPRDPEVLDAYLQIARCYRRLDLPLEAKASLEQAKAALARIDPEASFESTTNFSRAEWTEMLTWMSSL